MQANKKKRNRVDDYAFLEVGEHVYAGIDLLKQGTDEVADFRICSGGTYFLVTVTKDEDQGEMTE